MGAQLDELRRKHRQSSSHPPEPRAGCADRPTPTMASSALEGIKATLEQIVRDPAYHDVLSLLKTARNGAVYGTKVRFPHALVMIFLFRSGSFRQKLSLVLRATRHHASNLARFACIYKLTMLALKRFGTTPGKEGPYDSFFAGLLGGYFVFLMNEQINHCLSLEGLGAGDNLDELRRNLGLPRAVVLQSEPVD